MPGLALYADPGAAQWRQVLLLQLLVCSRPGGLVVRGSLILRLRVRLRLLGLVGFGRRRKLVRWGGHERGNALCTGLALALVVLRGRGRRRQVRRSGLGRGLDWLLLLVLLGRVCSGGSFLRGWSVLGVSERGLNGSGNRAGIRIAI